MKFKFSIELQITRNGNDKATLTDTSWQRIRKLTKKNSGSICHYCGEYADDGHLDHVVPLSRGGDDGRDNLVWSCPSCNFSKGAKLLDEWTPPHNAEVSPLVDAGLVPSGVPVELVENYIRSISMGETTAMSRWIGSCNPFSRSQYAKLISRLCKLEILTTRSDKDPARGYEFTPAGKEKIEYILELCQTPPPPRTDDGA